MAHIKLYILVENASSVDEAEQLAMRLLLATKLEKSKMQAAGHTVIAKAGAPCEVCGMMIGVQHRGVCPTCGMDLVVDRQLAEGPIEVTIPMQPAEALF